MTRSELTYINNQLCIPAYWLYSEYTAEVNGKKAPMPAIMTYNMYEHRVKNKKNDRDTGKKIHTVGHPGPGKPAMVRYDRLDENIKMLIRAALGGDPYKLSKRNIIERIITNDTAAADFFFDYTFDDGRHIRKEKQQQYLVHVWIFNAFTTILNSRKSMQYKHLGKTKGELWENFSDALNELDATVYPHKLPNHPKRLRDKYDKYIQYGYESIIHAGHGQKNASKTKSEEQEGILNRLLSDGRNLDNVQVANLYNIVADPLGWPQISSGTVANMRKKTEVLTAGGRRGLTEFRNSKTMQVKRQAPNCALYYWTLDGWDAELLYQKTETDRKGYSRTTFHNRLTMVVVLDAAVKYPVGLAIGTHETPELIKEALKDAANHINELFGQRYKPLQLQSDHYGKGTLTPLYEAMTDKYTPARVKNAKSKVIEPWFRYFNKNYCQYAPNWSGQGITSKKQNQPNSEMLNKNRNEFPDEMECRMQIASMVNAERKKKKDAYMQAYSKLGEGEKLVMSDESYLYWFGTSSKYTNRLEPSGLNVKILGQAKCYDSFDKQFRMIGNVDWQIKFDNDNLDKVLAINNDGTQRFLLQEKYVQPMALKERKEGDALALNQVNEYNKSLEETVIDFNARNYEITEKVMQDERLNGTLTKLMLTDSKGQHKNNKNELRKKTEALKEKTKEIAAQTSVKSWQEEQEEYLNSKLDISKYL